MIRTHFLGLRHGCGDDNRVSHATAAIATRGRDPGQRRGRRSGGNRRRGATIVAGTLATLWIRQWSQSGRQPCLYFRLARAQFFQAQVLLWMHNFCGHSSSGSSACRRWSWRSLLVLLSIWRTTWWCAGCATSMIGGRRSTYGSITLAKRRNNWFTLVKNKFLGLSLIISHLTCFTTMFNRGKPLKMCQCEQLFGVESISPKIPPKLNLHTNRLKKKIINRALRLTANFRKKNWKDSYMVFP